MAPRVQAYFAQIKYKPKPFYARGFLDAVGGGDLVGHMLPQPQVETGDGEEFCSTSGWAIAFA